MQQRYYDPIAGRFLSVDPVVTDANSGKMFGRYTYVENNPYRYTDPDGLKCSGAGDEAKCTVDLLDGKEFDREKLSDAQKNLVGKIESALTDVYKGANANANVTFSLQVDSAGNKSNVSGKEIGNILEKSAVNLTTETPKDGRWGQAVFVSRDKTEIDFFSKNIKGSPSYVASTLRQTSAHEPIHLAQEFRSFRFGGGDGHNQWFDPVVKALLKSSSGHK